MATRTRWYAELAGTILVWLVEVSGNPPFGWKTYIIRRPKRVGDITVEFNPDSFVEQSKESAVENAKLTIKNSPQFQEYGHRLNELRWQGCDLSEEDWEKQAAYFVAEGRMEDAS